MKNRKGIDSKFLEDLKLKVWNKAIGNNKITFAKHHYVTIQKDIKKLTGFSLSPDTVRNFLQDKHTPTPKTLDIFSTYILGGSEEHPKTFQDFQTWKYSGSTYDKVIEGFREGKTSRYLILSILGIILFLVVFITYNQNNGRLDNMSLKELESSEVLGFKQGFANTNLSKLLNNNWFFFPDSINVELFNEDNRDTTNQYLILRTYLGDSFLEKRHYKPQVINILSKKITCGECCEIEVKLVNFNPYQRYQQAGFYLFYDDDIPYPSLRYTLESSGSVSSILRDGLHSNRHLFTNYQNGVRANIYSVENEKPSNPIDSILLKITKELNQYYFSYRVNENDFVTVKSEKIELGSPKYIGLAAFQGRPDLPEPVYPVADFLPAYFEYYEIKPCEE